MKKALVLALAASMILSMGAMSATAAPVRNVQNTSQIQSNARIASNIPLASNEVIAEINNNIQGSINVPPNNFVDVSYAENGRVLKTLVNTNSTVANTSYLTGLKGTGFKTSLTNFLQTLVNRNITDYEINGVSRSKTGPATADEIQNAVMEQMQNRLKQITGSSFGALTAKMKHLAQVGNLPAKVVFTDANGNSYYVDFVIQFTGSTWATN